MFDIIEDEVFDKMNFEEKKQYIIDIVKSLPEYEVKLLHDKLEEAGVFDSMNNPEKMEEVLKGSVRKNLDLI